MNKILIPHLLTLTIAPTLMVGVMNRTKAIWSGRKGPPRVQLAQDIWKLLKKFPVYSCVTSWIFKAAPWIILGTTLVAGLIAPIFPGFSPISFSFDFIYFAYLLGLGRIFLIWSALDTGSSFEGMGASREATYSALIEPAFFLSIGTLSFFSGVTSFQELFSAENLSGYGWLIRMALGISLCITLQIEAARVPVDDPNTHLELTMIHEAMILDHSGPDLAALQMASALKLTIFSGLIAALLNPVSSVSQPALAVLVSLLLMILISIEVGLVESLIARFRLRSICGYALMAVLIAWGSLTIAAISRSVLE